MTEPASPSDCPGNDALEALLAADADLPSKQARKMEAHLSECADCRQRLEVLAETPAAIAFLGDYGAWQALAGPLQPVLDTVASREFFEAAGSPRRVTVDELKEWLDPTSEEDSVGRLGALEVRELLGQGGMGVVLRAWDPALEREVAVKLLQPALRDSPGLIRRFQEEARAVASLAHEYILPIHLVAEHRGLPYFVMPLITGATLAGRLRVEGPPPFGEALDIALRLGRALEAAHAAGIVHGDIKPGNILFGRVVATVPDDTGIDSPGALWLADFGIGRRLVTESEDDESASGPGDGAGTPGYAAPEVGAGGPTGIASDLYGLGRVFDALIDPDDPTVPPWFRNLIASMTATDPADRPKSAAEVIRALERGRDWMAARSWRKRFATRALRWGAAAAGIVLLLAAAAFASDAMLGTSLINRGLWAATGRAFTIAGRHAVFPDLATAAAAAKDGEVIEIFGEGPYLTSPVIIQYKSLTIRPAGINRPVLDSLPLVVNAILWNQYGALRVEGIAFRRELAPAAARRPYESVVQTLGGSLELIGCRITQSRHHRDNPTAFLVGIGHATERVHLKDCELAGESVGAIRHTNFGLIESTELVVEDCRFHSKAWIFCEAREGNEQFRRRIVRPELRIRASGFRVRSEAGLALDPTVPEKLTIYLDIENGLIETKHAVISLPGGDNEILRGILSLEIVDTTFANGSRFPVALANPHDPSLFTATAAPDEVAETWRMFWRLEPGQGPRWVEKIFPDGTSWDRADEN